MLKRLFWWTVFAAAFGYCEALVVVYLRKLCGMAPGSDYAPSIIAEMTRLGIYQAERTREIATILLLVGPACAAGRNWRERLGIFLFTFAVWDETYYLFLKVWTGFPQSITAGDVYFLLPIPWYGPVWFPVLVVMPALIVLSLWLLGKRAR